MIVTWDTLEREHGGFTIIECVYAEKIYSPQSIDYVLKRLFIEIDSLIIAVVDFPFANIASKAILSAKEIKMMLVEFLKEREFKYIIGLQKVSVT